MFDRRLLKNFDWFLLCTAFLLATCGIAMVYSATYWMGLSQYLKQLGWLGIGIIAMFVVMFVDYHTWSRFAHLFYLVSIGSLCLLFLFDHSGLGSNRWFRLGPIAFQPSELTKVATLLLLARYLSSKSRKFSRPSDLVIPLVIAGMPVLLILRQPDLGTASVFVALFLVLLYMAGVRPKHFWSLVGLGLAGAPLAWRALAGYQKARLVAFINPNADPLGVGYHIVQSKIAIGSGGFLGKGWLAGTQTRLNFLPGHYTDFIFPMLGEEWGFLGASLLLLLYFLLIMRGIKITVQAKDMLGSLLAMGATSILAFHIIVNIGMSMGIVPVTGLPLPFLSYGGSHLFATMVLVGTLLNVKMRQFMF
jgi:rod shape determining protein RodA